MATSVDTSKGAFYALATRNVDRFFLNDNNSLGLFETLCNGITSSITCSGQSDNEYPNFLKLPAPFNKLGQIKTANKVPLPAEILERFDFMKCNSMVGLFPEIERAWLTIDSDIYIWKYEDGGDVSYYDGLDETILCVGLIRPREGTFHKILSHLLVLTTAVDIVILGVTFGCNSGGSINEIQLLPDPIITVPTEGSVITTIVGTDCGRLFLGSKDGCLFEIVYRSETTWFGKKFKKINHSVSSLSFLVPSFLNAALSEDNPISQISIDNSRNILYTLSEKGSISVYDLGENGDSFAKIIKISQTTIVRQAFTAVQSLDAQHFQPIVSISAVEASESSFINLVAVSQTGVRFYFTVSNTLNLQPNQRPVNLTLFHVRIPPGFSASMYLRPRMVQVADYRQSNLLLISNVNDKDTLWCISSDMFPNSNMLMEAYTTVQLDAPLWAMAEVKQSNKVLPYPKLHQLPPLVVRQHYEPQRKFVMLTAQGAHIFVKLRPVDILRQLLIDSHGPENDAVKTFFMLLKEDQACATSLILACLESLQNLELSEWASRAFFLYGGDPRVMQQPIGSQSHQMGPPGTPNSFLPNIMSTPLPPHLQQPHNFSSNSMLDQSHNFATYSFTYSSRHNGLYIYLSRILRPIWNEKCVDKMVISKSKTYLVSIISPDTCSFVLGYLTVLRNFILKNTRLTICNSVNNNDTTLHSTINVIQQHQSFDSTNRLNNQTIQDAQLEERQSLDAFKHLLNHACQVLGLWRILSDHQFHILIDLLPVHLRQMLETNTFRDLILKGQDICIALIDILINTYLSDNAAIDSISSKLREVCPDLYRNEDATCSKVFEMLKTAKTKQNMDEREEIISSAIQLAKSVAPDINVYEICQQLASLEAYVAATDLCVACAKKIDPDGIAEYFYKNKADPSKPENYNYYTRRMKIYKALLNILDNLYNHACNIDATPRPIEEPQQGQQVNERQEKFDSLRRIVFNTLQFDDELLHVAIYEWMIAKKLDSDLIKIRQPSLEQYLITASQQSPDDTNILKLLWKHYESCNNHASAAKVLHNLSMKPGCNITLKERVGHLARAVMCMRSENIGYSPHFGVFLRDLEDKLEMAKVQEQILDAICNLPGRLQEVQEAINVLNNRLFDLTQLYEQFADPFNLWECKLAIIESAGYSDVALIENIWQHVIDEETYKASSMGDDKLIQVLKKVVLLIRRYISLPNCVPLPYIISKLEIVSIQLGANPSLVPITIAPEVPIQDIIQIYNDLISSISGDRFWTLEQNEFHLAEAFAELVNLFLDNQQQYDNNLRLKIKAPCEDTVAKLLSTLYSKPNAEKLIIALKNIQIRLGKC